MRIKTLHCCTIFNFSIFAQTFNVSFLVEIICFYLWDNHIPSKPMKRSVHGVSAARSDRYCDRWSSGSLAIVTVDLRACYRSQHLMSRKPKVIHEDQEFVGALYLWSITKGVTVKILNTVLAQDLFKIMFYCSVQWLISLKNNITFNKLKFEKKVFSPCIATINRDININVCSSSVWIITAVTQNKSYISLRFV